MEECEHSEYEGHICGNCLIKQMSNSSAFSAGLEAVDRIFRLEHNMKHHKPEAIAACAASFSAIAMQADELRKAGFRWTPSGESDVEFKGH